MESASEQTQQFENTMRHESPIEKKFCLVAHHQAKKVTAARIFQTSKESGGWNIAGSITRLLRDPLPKDLGNRCVLKE